MGHATRKCYGGRMIDQQISLRTNFHFSASELECPCCGLIDVSPDFLDRLTKAREMAGIPFRVASACRCPEHNIKVGGTSQSAHLTTDTHPCHAVDLIVRSSAERYTILLALLHAGFHRIGIGSGTLIHVDDDPALPPDVIWTYK